MPDPMAPSRPADHGFAVYVHWPFCASKCPYCDFNSHVRDRTDERAFLSAYLREIDAFAAMTGARTVASVFLGGGTPSLMSPATVEAIIDRIGRRWQFSGNAEITLEANPGSVEAGRFAGYRAAGVNRVSLGVQSLDAADLRALGRIHSVDEAKAAIAIARSTFARFSFDLIYARPRQAVDAWRRELGEALALAGGHLSLYQLTVEEGTPYAALHRAGKLATPGDDTALALYEATQEMCEAAGLPAYEISNHAAPGEESRHNLIYWRYGEYAGIGAGAHARIVHDGVRHALAAERNPEAWLRLVDEHGVGTSESAALTRAEEADEALLMGLRLSEGVDLARLAHEFGARPRADKIEELARAGWVELVQAGRRLRTTRKGRLVEAAIVREVASALEPTAPGLN